LGGTRFRKENQLPGYGLVVGVRTTMGISRENRRGRMKAIPGNLRGKRAGITSWNAFSPYNAGRKKNKLFGTHIAHRQIPYKKRLLSGAGRGRAGRKMKPAGGGRWHVWVTKKGQETGTAGRGENLRSTKERMKSSCIKIIGGKGASNRSQRKDRNTS